MAGISGPNNIVFPPFFNGDASGSNTVLFSNADSISSSLMVESLVIKNETYPTNGHKIFCKRLLRIHSGVGLSANGSQANSWTQAIGTGAPTAELGGGGDGGFALPQLPGGNSPTAVSLGGSGGQGTTVGGAALFPSIVGFKAQLLTNFSAMYSGVLSYYLGNSAGNLNSATQIISGGGGGGAGSLGSGQGGSGGGGGGILWIAADTIWLEAGAILSANGGNGGNAKAGIGTAGGGGGGGGGAIILFCNRFINEGATIQASGGTGGTGINGGISGANGIDGNIVVFTPQGINY
jgi:hypothetical protein